MNISQKTYSDLEDKLYRRFDSHRLSPVQVRELLEAYEHAVILLDNLVGVSHNASGSKELLAAEEFLYLDNGQPRVILSAESNDT